ncbi:MAG: transposase [Cyclobacteriaceae bacterium]|nr:transposase [Cyclobacteriaceae bacterium]
MSGSKFIISDQYSVYFITCTVINWLDLFSRKDYRDVIVDSLNFCVENKFVNIFSWVIMTNHIHLVVQCDPPGRMSDFLRDFKKHTSKEFIRVMKNINESRSNWLLRAFKNEAQRTKRAENFKIWKDDNHPVDLSDFNIMEKIDYIHENPVRAGWVDFPEQYVYSSARDYNNGKGLVKVVIV